MKRLGIMHSLVVIGVGGMERLRAAEPENLVLWLAVLGIAIAVAYYVIQKIRPRSGHEEPTASQWLTGFGDLHAKGDLSDEEFRTIKTILSQQLQDELKTDEQNDSNE
jgi:uncharacterized membrane protein